MKKKLFGALEDLDGNIEFDTDLSLEEISELIEDAEDDIDESVQDFDDMEEVIEEAEGAVERLEAIRDTIVKYGISAPMMVVADPTAELVAAGICGTYEELGEVPMQDDNAHIAIEGLNSALKTAKIKIASALSASLKMLKQMALAFNIFLRTSESKMSALAVSISRIATHDDDAFAARKIRSFNKADFAKVVVAQHKLIEVCTSNIYDSFASDVASFAKGKITSIDDVKKNEVKYKSFLKSISEDKSVRELLGIVVELMDADRGRGFMLQRKAVKSLSKGTTHDLGWKFNDAIPTLKSTLGMLRESRSLLKRVDSISKLHDTVLKTMTNSKFFSGDITSEELAAYNYACSVYAKNISFNRNLIKMVVSATKLITKSTINLASAAHLEKIK